MNMTMFIDYDRTCGHINAVDDDVSGDRICTDCGLVLDRVYKFQFFEKMEEIKSPLPQPYPSANVLSRNILYNDIIKRVIDKCHVNNKRIRKNVKRDVFLMIKKHKKICPESLVLASIYVNLIKEQSPRPIGDLCSLTNVKEKNVWHYVEKSQSFYRPHLMTECFLKPLELTFKSIKEINKLVKLAETKYVFSPKTLIASCAYLYLRNNDGLHFCNRDNSDLSSFTVNRFCKIINVSHMALQKCINKIEKI